MHELDLKRCQHCVHPIATIQVEESDCLRLDAPLLLCFRCDRMPHPEDALFVPDSG